MPVVQEEGHTRWDDASNESHVLYFRTLSHSIFSTLIGCITKRVSINLKVVANFSDKLYATHVIIKIPVPKNTARSKIKVSYGRAKYEPKQ